MEIKDLKPGMGKIDIVVTIKDVSEEKQFEKFGKAGRVAKAVAFDATGTIKMSLWNEQIDDIKTGDKIYIKNGYVSEWQGEMQLGTGKFGSLEVVEKSAKKPKEKEDVITTSDEEYFEEEDIEY